MPLYFEQSMDAARYKSTNMLPSHCPLHFPRLLRVSFVYNILRLHTPPSALFLSAVTLALGCAAHWIAHWIGRQNHSIV